VRGNATRLSYVITTQPTNGEYFSFPAITCKDRITGSDTYNELKSKEQMLAALSRHTKGTCNWARAWTICDGWASAASNPQHIFDANQAAKLPNIFLVNSLYDTATSIAWANDLRDQIPSAVLIVRNGVGHTNYLMFGPTSATMDAFLLAGSLPVQGTTYH
jgi:TAP-like protein